MRTVGRSGSPIASPVPRDLPLLRPDRLEVEPLQLLLVPLVGGLLRPPELLEVRLLLHRGRPHLLDLLREGVVHLDPREGEDRQRVLHDVELEADPLPRPRVHDPLVELPEELPVLLEGREDVVDPLARPEQVLLEADDACLDVAEPALRARFRAGPEPEGAEDDPLPPLLGGDLLREPFRAIPLD